MWENNTTAIRRRSEIVVIYICIIDITEIIIIIIWRNFIGKAGPNCWKMVIKSIRKLTRIRNNGTIQLQFFHRRIIGETGSKFLMVCHVIRDLPLDWLKASE